MAVQQIKSRFDDRIVYECEAESLLVAVQAAIVAKVSLRGSDLSYSDLRGSNLSYSNLSYSNLSYSNLSYSNLRGSNLSYSNLRYSNLSYSNLSYSNLSYSNLSYSNLRYSDLRGARIDWESHCLIGEFLRSAAGEDVEKRKIAGLVATSPDWCWSQFLAIDEPLRDWALGVLAGYVMDGDNAPKAIVDIRAEAGS